MSRDRPARDPRSPVITRLAPTTKRWFVDLARSLGLRQAELLRRLIEEARRRDWHPSGM